MIVVTLGTIPYSFNRAIEWLTVLLSKGAITEPVFVQYGTSDIKSLESYEQVTLEAFVPSSQLTELIDNARLVISHAGQGSTRMLAARGASFTLLPRLKLYGEHVDDHQLLFSQSVAPLGVKHCLTLKDLEQSIFEPPAPLQTQLFSGPKLSDHLQMAYPR
jgi:UDP-N-acetylglucosamine transferase subunit ALG13